MALAPFNPAKKKDLPKPSLCIKTMKATTAAAILVLMLGTFACCALAEDLVQMGKAELTESVSVN